MSNVSMIDGHIDEPKNADEQRTIQEHIKIIDAMMESLKFSTVDRKPILPTLQAAKEAMEKQIPGKVTIPQKGLWRCPECRHIMFEGRSFCDECGKALYYEEGGEEE